MEESVKLQDSVAMAGSKREDAVKLDDAVDAVDKPDAVQTSSKGTPEKKKVVLDLAKIPPEFRANGLSAVSMQLVQKMADVEDPPAQQRFSPLFVYQFFDEPYDREELEKMEKKAESNGETNGKAQEDMDAEEDSEEDGSTNGDDSQNGTEGAVSNEDVDEGLIVGYKDLSVQLFFTPATLEPFLRVHYTAALPPSERSTPDLLAAVEEIYGHKIITTPDAFQIALTKDHQFKPIGTKLRTFTLSTKAGAAHNLELYEVGDTAREFGYPSRFGDILANIQPFLAWFIYGASILSTDDTRWLHYLLYEVNGDGVYSLVGYSSVYRYWMLPKKNGETSGAWKGEFSTRCRIAQFIVVPPYQKKGFGARLLKGVIERLQEDPKTFDISVEDPDEAFVRLYNAVVSRLVKDYIQRKGINLDLASGVDASTVHSLSVGTKFPKKTLMLVLDVLACSQARTVGQEATKKFYDIISKRTREKVKGQQRDLTRKMNRVAKGYYTFSEDEQDAERQMSTAGWTYNLNKEMDSVNNDLKPDKIKERLHETTKMVTHAAKRMDELDF
ncbi:histone acetyltransferase type B catalytic subunit-like [Paramacrobiotus metropolitanus]|uniref:histone acetyltransferase type B catalytic subunit-like n=1 Tax=Paramacrobiotus metropolitanus TaxID=2943436 RepID=UPI0024455E87|nr:histone acetyltransferase type B catalytic subunit-like [Paramacrobiotus metropolitanus]